MATPVPATVRPLRWGDFDDLREIYFHLYDERAAGYPIGIHLYDRRPSLADESVWFQNHFRAASEGDEIFLVAERAEHVVGSCTIGPMGAGPRSEEGHVGQLGIIVHHEHRGVGVGTALLERSLAEARSKFELVYLSVFSVNQGAQKLYRRFGFVPCGHFPRIVKRGGEYFDEERMVLNFSAAPDGTGANR